MDDKGLHPAEQRFVEQLGLYFERQGVARIGGRILALLMLSERPLALGRIAELLKVSPASVSTNMRQFLAAGLAEHHGEPGDRRHYYMYARGVWERRLEAARATTAQLARLCEDALGTLPGDGRTARQRLRETLEFCDFYDEELSGAARRWRARRTPSSLPAARRTRARG